MLASPMLLLLLHQQQLLLQLMLLHPLRKLRHLLVLLVLVLLVLLMYRVQHQILPRPPRSLPSTTHGLSLSLLLAAMAFPLACGTATH
jgi:hypothetical protein